VILCDVNVLVYAHREDAVDHERYAAWLDEALDSEQAYGVSELVLSRFVRVVTNGRMVQDPATIGEALAFANELREKRERGVQRDQQQPHLGRPELAVADREAPSACSRGRRVDREHEVGDHDQRPTDSSM
jgi:predicted nucleic acid-binding protein